MSYFTLAKRLLAFGVSVFAASALGSDSFFSEVVPTFSAKYQYVDEAENGQSRLYLAWGGEIAGYQLPGARNRATLVWETPEQATLLHLTISGRLNTNIIANPHLSADEQSIYYTANLALSGTRARDATDWLHRYDISTGETYEYAMPELFDDQAINASSVMADDYLYFLHEKQLYQFDVEAGTWSAINLPLPERCSDTSSFNPELRVVDSQQRAIIFSACGAAVIAVSADGSSNEIIQMPIRPPLDYADYITTWWAQGAALLAPASKETEVFYYGRYDDKYYLWDIASAEKSVESLFSHSDIKLLDTNQVFAVSKDGRYLVYIIDEIRLKTHKNDSSEYFRAPFLVYDRVRNQYAFIRFASENGQYNRLNSNADYNLKFLDISAKDNELHVITKHNDENSNRHFLISLDEVFNNEFPTVRGIAISTPEDFSAEISNIDYDGELLKLRRVHMESGDVQEYYLSGEAFSDVGITTPGNINYQFIPCKANFLCNEQDIANSEPVYIEDIATVPEFTLEVLAEGGDFVGYNVTLTNEKEPGTVQLVYTDNRTDKLNIEETSVFISKGVSEALNSNIILQNCFDKGYGYTLACSSNISSRQTILIPEKNNGHIMPFADESGFAIHWKPVTGGRYTLSRILEGETESIQLLQDSDTLFYHDTEYPEISAEYTLMSCVASGCVSQVLHRTAIDEADTHIEFLKTSLKNQLYFSANLHADLFKLIRTLSRSTQEPVTVFESDSASFSFIDEDIIDGGEYLYTVQSCTQNICTETASLNVIGGIEVPDYFNPDIPGPLSNFELQMGFMSYRLLFEYELPFRAPTSELKGYGVSALYRQKNSENWKSGNTGINNFTLYGNNNAGAYVAIMPYYTSFYDDGFYPEYGPASYYSLPEVDASTLPVNEDFKLDIDFSTANSPRIYLTGDPYVDVYHLWVKAPQDSEFSLLYTQRINVFSLYTGGDLYFNLPEEFQVQGTEFYVQGCSRAYAKCSEQHTVYTPELSEPETELVDFDNVQVSVAAPLLEWTSQGLNVTAQIHSAAQLTKVKFYRVDSGEVIQQQAQSINYRGEHSDFSDLNIGDTLSWQTQYCFVALVELIEQEVCSALSDIADFTLTEEMTRLAPFAPLVTDVIKLTSSQMANISFNVNFSDSVQRADIVATPTELEVLQRSSTGEYSVVHQMSLVSPESGVQAVSFDIATGQHLNLVARVCSEQQCSEHSQEVSVDLINDVSGDTIPEVPEIVTSKPSPVVSDILLKINAEMPGVVHEIVVSNSATDASEHVVLTASTAESDYVLNALDFNQTLYLFVRTCSYLGCSNYTAATSLNALNNMLVTSEYHFDSEDSLLPEGGSVIDIDDKKAFAGEINSGYFLPLAADTALDFQLYLPLYVSELLSVAIETQHVSTGENTVYLQNLFSIAYRYGEEAELHSPFWDTPILFTDGYEEWINLKVALNEDGLLSLYYNEELLSVSDRGLDLNIWEYSKITVNTGHHVLGNFSIAGAAPELMSFVPFTASGGWITDDKVQLLFRHPEWRKFEYLNTAINRVKLWQVNTETGEYAHVFDGDPVQAASLLTSLPASDTLNLVSRSCIEDVCAPAYFMSDVASDYTYIHHDWSDIHTELSAAGVNVRFAIFNEQWESAQSFTLYRNKAGSTEPELIFSDDFAALYPLADDDYYYTYNDTSPPEESYYYQLEVCTPLNCVWAQSELVITSETYDIDDDGVPDIEDAFPFDPHESTDTDGDGIGDNSDPDIDNDGLSNTFENRLGLDPYQVNDLESDVDGDGYNELMEVLSGADPNDYSKTPNDFGYFESFEQAKSAHLSFFDYWNEDDSVSFDNWHIEPETESRVNDAQHGENAYVFTPSERQGETTSIYYRGYLASGYIWFALKDAEQVPAVKVDNRHISFDADNQIALSDGYTIYTYRVANQSEATSQVIITISGEWSSLDSVYLPGSGVCQRAGQINQQIDLNCDGQAEFAGISNNTDSGHTEHLDKVIRHNTVNKVTLSESSGLIPISGDFDGDGITDLGFRNPSTKHYVFRRSSDNDVLSGQFGLQEGDILVIGDYDGDGKSDLALRRPWNTTWYIKPSSYHGIERIRFGLDPEDIPVQGDYDGDGKTDLAVARLKNQMWYVKYSSDDSIGRIPMTMNAGDIPITADVDGDGKSDLIIRRPETFTWWIKRSSDGQEETVTFGKRKSDIPVVNDYDGDGKADLAVRRDSNHHFYVLRSSDGQLGRYPFANVDRFIPLAAPIQMRMQFAAGDWSFIEQD
ncbi:FG-GAP-like repeat-containing protein [Planctobacterium marinum]|uniref:FG-GAP-like repeat-containing protein n=1 Tax=Planctobacterium marinum TaxID=1631968 RepID=UPI001E5A4F5A|nr:FG-GAP-like repeat-containing protein [Planctobacterium marinum]MCC2606409.1 FG-GAP-like repeat-containing protein [Planctobacterium marinum]